jgi:cytochrome c oxidase cbb3-type subunit 3
MRQPRTGAALALLAAALALTACERETRGYHVAPFHAGSASAPSDSGLRPGPAASTASQPAAQMPSAAASVVVPMQRIDNRYESNAYAIAQGQRWFRWYNCSGCHGNGGGNMGPPLMDAKWIYGSAPAQIAATILQGRPNGMPAFAGRIPDDQLWQIVAYVRSLSGQVREDAAPGRSDTIYPGTPPSQRSQEPAHNAPPH